ncbi:AraC family transcriptional regulator [Epidermidibacterium keratini]
MHGYRIEDIDSGVHIGMPSTTLTVIVALEEPLLLGGAAGARPSEFESVVAGLHTTPAHIHHGARQVGLQVSLDPTAARTLFGVPAAELAATERPLHELIGVTAGELDQIRAVTTWPDRLAALERLLTRRPRDDRPASAAAHSWRAIGRSGGSVRVAELSGDVGYSPRRLQQLFRAEYGVSAKEAASLRRFERAHRMVAAGGVLAEVAMHCGYADQAHLTRDWRRFAGMPPTQWLREDLLRYGR